MKNLKDIGAIYNPEITADQLLSILSQGMPAWQWRIKRDEGDKFEINGKLRWHILVITRNAKGQIGRKYDDSILWAVCSLGLTYALSQITSARHRGKVLKLLKEHVQLQSA